MALSGEAAARASALSILHAGQAERSPEKVLQREEEMKSSQALITLALAAGLGTLLAVTTVRADEASDAAYKDIEATLGQLPHMFTTLPDPPVAGPWAEIKGVQLNPNTALDGKTKELLGLAVAAQIPCQYCIYFHTRAAKAYGASDEEIKEAVAMASIVRHWSTMLNGSQVDLATFKKQTDEMLAHAAKASQ
jgi:AhpD family alkylhydroperoxidase